MSAGVYLLANSHLITFIYGTLFLSIFLTALALLRGAEWIRVGLVAGAIVAGSLGASHQLIPISTSKNLIIRSTLGPPIDAKKYAPLDVVLGVGPAEPEPAGGGVVTHFWPQLGLPILLALGYALYLLSNRRPERMANEKVALAALLCLGFSLLTGTGTLDIWRVLPEQFYVIQFPYRLLTFAALFGALLSALVVEYAFARNPGLPAGVFLVLLTSAALWQPRFSRNERTLTQVLAAPDLGYGSAAYLISQTPGLSPPGPGPIATEPLITGDGWLNLKAKLKFSRSQVQDSKGTLRLTGHQVAAAQGCSELHVLVGAKSIIVPATQALFTATVTADQLREAAGPASEFEVGFDSPCAFVPGPQDTRRLFMSASSWEFGPPDLQWVRGNAARRVCKLQGASLRCDVVSEQPTELVLPMLYYAGALRIRVNGQESSVAPVPARGYLYSRVSLPAGKSTVIAEFVGSGLGNAVSLLSLALWLSGIAVALWRYRRT